MDKYVCVLYVYMYNAYLYTFAYLCVGCPLCACTVPCEQLCMIFLLYVFACMSIRGAPVQLPWSLKKNRVATHNQKRDTLRPSFTHTRTHIHPPSLLTHTQIHKQIFSLDVINMSIQIEGSDRTYES